MHKLSVMVVLKFVFLITLSVLVVLPIASTFLGGFKSLGELRNNPLFLPQTWHGEYYLDILKGRNFWLYLKNSFVIMSCSVVFTLILSSMAAFCFVHIRFIGRQFFFQYILLGMMFPFAVAIVPLFIKVMNIGLQDTHLGVILPQVAFGLGSSMLLFRNAFDALPHELFDAARIDGCSYKRFYWQIVLPLSLPIIMTVGLFVMVNSWNNYMLPLIILDSQPLYPWSLGMMDFRGQYSVEWNRILAFVSLNIIPTLILFAFAQKYIIAGFTGGSVKG